MRRSLTYLTVLLLLIVGGYFTQQVMTEGALPLFTPSSPMPELPVFNFAGYQVPGALLLMLIAGFILFNVVGMGVTLAILFGRASRELRSTPAAGAPSGAAATKKEDMVPPGTPVSDRTAIGIVVAFILLGVVWGIGRFNSPLPPIPDEVALPLGVNVPGWALFALIAAALLGATLVTGIVLSRLFAVLAREVAMAGASPPRPMDFGGPIRFVKGLRQIRLTFAQKVFTCLDVVLVLAILTVVGAFVIPSYLWVTRVDRAAVGLQATSTPPPTAAATQAPSGNQAGAMQAAFDALPTGDAAAGESLFKGQPCAACHSLTADAVLVGPSLAGVGDRAETRIPGYSTQAYLYESLVQPNAYVVEGFQPGVMPQNFGETLSDQQLSDIIAFLLTQR